MKIYEVEVRDPNRMVPIGGRLVRSPFKAKVDQDELKVFLFQMKSLSVINYGFQLVSQPDVDSLTNIKDDKSVITEETEVTIIELKNKAEEIVSRLVENI